MRGILQVSYNPAAVTQYAVSFCMPAIGIATWIIKFCYHTMKSRLVKISLLCELKEIIAVQGC